MPNVKKQDVNKLIEIVLSDLEKSKFINDKFYSESKARSMINRGSSINKIRSYLLGKGIDENYINNTVEQINDQNSDQDFFSAIKICSINPIWLFVSFVSFPASPTGRFSNV